jgi:putative nucleotidyltransferase with HDIG domain
VSAVGRSERPSRTVLAVHWLALAAAGVVAVITAPDANWNLPLFAVLLACSVGSDITAMPSPASKMKLSGSFLSLILAMILLGGAPAALIGVVTMLAGWLRWHDKPADLLNNVATYALFPLIGGIVFDSLRTAFDLDSKDAFYYVLILATFGLALLLNFLLIASYRCYVDRKSLRAEATTTLAPVLASELASAVLAGFIVFLYMQVGLAAIVLFAVVLGTFQYLLGELLKSERRGRDLDRSNRELEQSNRQMASFQVGMLSALLHTLDLRDRMTARHSAAVAHYSREMARAAGFSEPEQELVHTAALLHDIGKFIFPDHILAGDGKPSQADWQIIRSHPYEGARIVSHIRGYGPVSEIILAHHERIDGKGYPRGLMGDEIPAFSRIISVADTYDVMTARDSYKDSCSSMEAIQELRRVAGSQLDAYFVDLFIELLAGKDLSYRHGEDADFDAELQLERRVMDYASGRAAGAI